MTLKTKAFSLLLYGLQVVRNQTAGRHKDFLSRLREWPRQCPAISSSTAWKKGSGPFCVEIFMDGFEERRIEVDLEESVNLGVIFLHS